MFNKKLHEVLFWVLIASMCFVLFAKCNPQKRMIKLYKKHPALVAKLARDKYPCIDKDTIVKDSVIYYDREIEVQVEVPVHDTLTGETKYIYQWAKQKVRDSIVYRTKTIKVLDSAFNKITQSKLDSVISTTSKNITSEQSKKKSLKVLTIIAALLAVGGWGAFLLKGKLSILSIINNALKIVNKKVK